MKEIILEKLKEIEEHQEAGDREQHFIKRAPGIHKPGKAADHLRSDIQAEHCVMSAAGCDPALHACLSGL